MNIYLIERGFFAAGWDEYLSAVVIAESEMDARRTHPSKCISDWDGTETSDWVDCNDVVVSVLGMAHGRQEAGVVCSDYNAG
tara:strand:+ start:484 stop:729 length:246 start_codon:yes stop_codon:yes gene_type:complete